MSFFRMLGQGLTYGIAFRLSNVILNVFLVPGIIWFLIFSWVDATNMDMTFGQAAKFKASQFISAVKKTAREIPGMDSVVNEAAAVFEDNRERYDTRFIP